MEYIYTPTKLEASAIMKNCQKILLVEDQKHTRQFLEKKISQNNDCFVSAVGTFQGAKTLLLEQTPDFLVLDLGLPDGNGLDLIGPAILANPEMLILVLTVFGEDASVVRAIQAGAKGYLLKDRALEEIGDVLVSMREGHSPIDHRVARALLELVSGRSDPKPSEGFDLSRSEKAVLAHIAQGRQYKEIAYEMDISINTVREYIRRIYKKLQVNSRFDAVQCVSEYNIALD